MSVVTKDIVFGYLAGQGTLLQKKQIDEWLLDSRNQETYSEWLDAWERLHPQFSPSVDEAYERFSRFVDTEEITHTSNSSFVDEGAPHKLTKSIIVSVAAAAAFVLLFLFRDSVFYRSYITGNAEVKTIELSDHSIVTLNANSVLRVSRFFRWAKSRSARLTGEASFDIRHTLDDRPFQVFIPGNVEIRVLGTEFNVYARNDHPKIFLNRGSIQLSSTDSSFKSLLVKPGELVNVNFGREIAINHNQSFTQVSAWKDHVFVFDRTSLEQVARMLEEQFGNKVCISDTSLGNRVISGSCKWTKEEDILTTLSLMMKFNVYQANDTILLK